MVIFTDTLSITKILETMKKIFGLLLLLPTLLLAQKPKKDSSLIANDVFREQSRVNAVNNIMSQNTSSQMLYYKPNEVDIKGSPFFYDEFVKGEIWFKDGTHVDKDLFKFDELKNAVVVKGTDGVEYVLESKTVLGCRMIINDKPVLYFRGEVPNVKDDRKIFQLVYNSDKYRVIKLPVKRLIPREKTFHNDLQGEEFRSEHRFFVQTDGGAFQEFGLKKKEILRVFADRQATLSALFDKPMYKEKLTEQSLSSLITDLEAKK
jgi:hypothetical protein